MATCTGRKRSSMRRTCRGPRSAASCAQSGCNWTASRRAWRERSTEVHPPHRAPRSYPRHGGATRLTLRCMTYRHTPRPHDRTPHRALHSYPRHGGATRRALRCMTHRHTPRLHDRGSVSRAHTRRTHSAIAPRGRLGLLCTGKCGGTLARA